MGTQLKVCFAVSFAVLLISLATNYVSATAATLDGNTNFSEFIGEEGEPLMESEVSRSLLGTNPTRISYPGMQDKSPFCHATYYRDCIRAIGKDHRPCTVYTRCDRGPPA
jgi:hypothetical protein